ncbi:hypothetical protein Tco_1524554, partial [Tanacetum coccineum]
MASMMTTRNAGRRAAITRGGRTGGRTGRGGGRTGEQTGRGGGQTNDQGAHISDQGINESQNDNAADDSTHECVRNVNMNNGQNGCSYKEFMECKPKEFDGKGGAVAYTHWVEKMEAIQDISGCGDHQKSAILNAEVITDEAIRNGSLKRSGERKGDGRESSKEGNVRGDNKRARTVK